jgi:hypothetical protein
MQRQKRSSFSDSSPDLSANTLQPTNVQKSFSFRALLNNMTAPVRRSKQQEKPSSSSKNSTTSSNEPTKKARRPAKQDAKMDALFDSMDVLFDSVDRSSELQEMRARERFAFIGSLSLKVHGVQSFY